jgi:hypothetical protein
VQQTSFSANQEIAADVSDNGAVSSFDAALVAQFAAVYIDHFPVADHQGSDWAFLRCDNYVDASNHDCTDAIYLHDPLAQPETDDFYAILYGDVTGNWTAPAGKSAISDEDRKTPRPADVKRQRSRSDAAYLSVTGWTGPLAAGEKRELLFTIVKADGIEALDLKIDYNPERIRIVQVSRSGIGSQFNLVSHDVGGRHNIGMYGLLPLEGSGAVLSVTVEALSDLGRAHGMRVSGQANEKQIPLVIMKRPEIDRDSPRGSSRRAR